MSSPILARIKPQPSPEQTSPRNHTQSTALLIALARHTEICRACETFLNSSDDDAAPCRHGKAVLGYILAIASGEKYAAESETVGPTTDSPFLHGELAIEAAQKRMMNEAVESLELKNTRSHRLAFAAPEPWEETERRLRGSQGNRIALSPEN